MLRKAVAGNFLRAAGGCVEAAHMPVPSAAELNERIFHLVKVLAVILLSLAMAGPTLSKLCLPRERDRKISFSPASVF
jgi:hypothetical protein